MRGVAYSVRERELLMRMHEKGKSLSVLSRETGIARSLLSAWWLRYQQEGRAGLQPRSRRPEHSPDRLPTALIDRILQLRKLGWGPARIALDLRVGRSSVHRLLCKLGRNHLRQPTPRIFTRYEKSRPGEMLHLDLKYLYRWENTAREFAYAAVDDFSREAVAMIRPARTSHDAACFLEYVAATLPYRVESVLTDNDLIFSMRYAYNRDRQTRFQRACKALGIAHRLTRPFHPQSNGKVERFFRTMNEECFHVKEPGCSELRVRDLDQFVWYYNHQRPHLSLHGLTPIQRREAYFQQAHL